MPLCSLHLLFSRVVQPEARARSTSTARLQTSCPTNLPDLLPSWANCNKEAGCSDSGRRVAPSTARWLLVSWASLVLSSPTVQPSPPRRCSTTSSSRRRSSLPSDKKTPLRTPRTRARSRLSSASQAGSCRAKSNLPARWYSASVRWTERGVVHV
ncbi:hypothetical protein IWZ00DRAFT_508736 [Phyllosticta capitalensis]